MIPALSRVNTRRLWYVPQLNVWGAADWTEMEYLTIENDGSAKSVLFGKARIGDEYQSVKFSDLIDFRGNALPSSLKNPRVVIRPHGDYSAFLVGDETSDGFHLARQSGSTGPVTVDLLIVELGD